MGPFPPIDAFVLAPPSHGRPLSSASRTVGFSYSRTGRDARRRETLRTAKVAIASWCEGRPEALFLPRDDARRHDGLRTRASARHPGACTSRGRGASATPAAACRLERASRGGGFGRSGGERSWGAKARSRIRHERGRKCAGERHRSVRSCRKTYMCGASLPARTSVRRGAQGSPARLQRSRSRPQARAVSALHPVHAAPEQHTRDLRPPARRDRSWRMPRAVDRAENPRPTDRRHLRACRSAVCGAGPPVLPESREQRRRETRASEVACPLDERLPGNPDGHQRPCPPQDGRVHERVLRRSPSALSHEPVLPLRHAERGRAGRRASHSRGLRGGWRRRLASTSRKVGAIV